MKPFFKRSIGELFSAGFSAAASPFTKAKLSTDQRRTTLEYLILRRTEPQDETNQTTPDGRTRRR